jgi:hypothetical protein
MILALLAGCHVVDAPADFQDLTVFGFTRFDGPRSQPEAAVGGLEPLTVSLADDLADGMRVTDLTADDLEQVGLDGAIESGIVGSAATVHMVSAVDDVARAWSNPHMDEVLDGTLAFELTVEDGDHDCFLAHRCETYAYDGTRTLDMGLFGTATQAFHRDFRWVELDDEVVLTERELVPDGSEMSANVVAVHQQFGYSVFYPDDGTKRLDTFWIDAEVIGMDVPDAFALDFAVNGMQSTAEQVDAWVAANP